MLSDEEFTPNRATSFGPEQILYPFLHNELEIVSPLQPNTLFAAKIVASFPSEQYLVSRSVSYVLNTGLENEKETVAEADIDPEETTKFLLALIPCAMPHEMALSDVQLEASAPERCSLSEKENVDKPMLDP